MRKIVPPFILLYLLMGLSLTSVVHGVLSPAENERLIDKLFSNPQFLDAQVSPDGRYLAFLSYMNGERCISVLDLEKMKFEGTRPGLGYDIDTFYWIDEDHIVYHVSRWEYYTYGIFLYSAKRNSTKRLNNPARDREIFGGMVDPLLHMEDTFVFSGRNSDSVRGSDLFMMDVRGFTGRKKLATNTGDIFRYMVDRSGQPVFALESRSRSVFLLEWEPRLEQWKDAAALGSYFEPIGLLSGSDFLVVEVENEEGYNGLNLLDLEAGAFPNPPRFLPGYDMRASGATITYRDNLTGYILGFQLHLAKPVNFWLKPGLDKVDALIKTQFDDHVLQFLGFDPGSNSVFYYIYSDTVPPAVYRLYLETRELSRVYNQFPDAEDLPFRPMEPVSFESADGKATLHGYLTKPEGEGPHPTVLMIHGGPHVRDTWEFNPQVQFLALNGYAVLQINYRGSSGYGDEYGDAPLSTVAEYSVDDVITGARWIVDEGIADPSRLGIMGGSFGGYISLAASARQPSLFSAVIGYAGVYDFNELYEDDKRGRLPTWFDDFYADYSESLYASISPVNRAKDITDPVLIIHGKEDSRVDVSQAKDMIRALKEAGNEPESLFIGWGVHGLPEEKDRQRYYRTIIEFLARHLDDKPAVAGK